MGANSLVTLQTYDNSVEAHMVKNHLENHDIPCFIFDENTVSLNPLWNLTVGGIKVKVLQSDLTKAQEALNEISRQKFLSEDDQVIVCPKCGSTHLTQYKAARSFKSILALILSFIWITYPLSADLLFKCNDCGHEFEKSELK